MRTSLYFLFLCIFIPVVLHAQNLEDLGYTVLNDLIVKHYNYVEKLPQEKSYLHLDKAFYSSGETIWFSAYLVDARSKKPSEWSNILYVDLLSEDRKVIDSKKLNIRGGFSHGEFILPDDIASGTYFIRAYTSWMRNFDEGLFFSRIVPIYNIGNEIDWEVQSAVNQKEMGSLVRLRLKLSDLEGEVLGAMKVEGYTHVNTKVTLKKTIQLDEEGRGTIDFFFPNASPDEIGEINLEVAQGKRIFKKKVSIPLDSKADIQFFPEGGYLVNGLESRLGFKGVAHNGRAIPLEGQIVDEGGNVITTFKSEHLGMGIVEFTPKKGSTYQAKLPKFGLTIDLPQAINRGAVMRVINILDNSLRINMHCTQNNKEKYLIIQSNGEIVKTLAIDGRNKEFSQKFERIDLPAGVLQVTIIDEDRLPLAERLIYNERETNLSFQISSNKEAYMDREKVELTVSAQDALGMALPTHFSVAVTDVEQVNESSYRATDINSYMLLESDVKGYIEDPNYYFEEASSQRRHELDLLMLTQGWRRYDITKTISKTPEEMEFPIEKGLYVSGNLTTKKKEPKDFNLLAVAYGKVNFSQILQANSTGEFFFDYPDNQDTTEVIIQTTNMKGKKRAIGIEVDKPFHEDTQHWQNRHPKLSKTPLSYIKESRQRLLMDSIFNGMSIDLDEILVTERRAGDYDFAYDPNDIENRNKYNSVFALLQAKQGGYIRFIEGNSVLFLNARINGKIEKHPPVFLIDGRLVWNADYETLELNYDIEKIPMEDIAAIRVKMPNPNSRTYLSPWATGKFKPTNDKRRTESIVTNSKVNSTLGLGKGSTERRSQIELTVVEITTKSGTFRNSRSIGMNIFTINGYHQARSFYNPKYDVKRLVQSEPDTRPTLYWNPALTTDANGEAKLSFFTSDRSPVMQVTIQGTDKKGNFDTQRYILNRNTK